MNDLQRLNLMIPKGAKLDDIITAIQGKGGTVASPQKVAEIVSAINDVASWDADLIASNIRDGIDILGIVGGLVEGKPSATGSMTLNPGQSYNYNNLGFYPRVAIAKREGPGPNEARGRYRSLLDNTTQYDIINATASGVSNLFNGGLTINNPSGQSYAWTITWVAWGD